MPQVQPSSEVWSTASASDGPGLLEQIGDAHPAPPGVADQVATDRVGDAAQRHPGLGELAGEQVRVGQHDLASTIPWMRSCHSSGSIVGYGEGGVDPVEVVVGRPPRRDARPARSARRRGTRASVTGRRSCRRACSTCRRPQPRAGRRRRHRRRRHRPRRGPGRCARRCRAVAPGAVARRGAAALRAREQVEADQPGHEAEDQRHEVAAPSRPARRARAATPATARRRRPTTPAHQPRRASTPASAKTTAQHHGITVHQDGLSQCRTSGWPSRRLARA